MKRHLLLLLASMIAIVNSCQLGNEGIQCLYDRFELFRKRNAFDVTNHNIRTRMFSHEESSVIKHLTMQINNEVINEEYITNSANVVETISGYYLADKVTLNYKRDENGALIFEDLSNGKHRLTLRSIDDELPNNFEEDYQKVFLDLKALRQKMFDFRRGLSKYDFERVNYINLIRANVRSQAVYIENGSGGGITVTSNLIVDGKETISGRMKCHYKSQNFNVIDGKVVVDGEPYYSS